MASYKGCFYLQNGEYVETSYKLHLLRQAQDSSYARRRFIALSGYLLEVSEQDYRALKKEQARQEYLKRCQASIRFVPLHCANLYTGEDMEQAVLDKMQLEDLRNALLTLDSYEFATYKALFVDNYTEREYAILLGVSQQAVNKYRAQLIAKLRRHFGLLE